MYETENVEFKSQLSEGLYKEIIAFANTVGGIIYIGVDDEGNEIGLKDVDEEYTAITSGVRDAILPDVTMYVRYELQRNRVLKITVEEGTNKPYYLKGKGLRPAGVFVRQGTSSVQASPDSIRKMIKDSDGDIFEEMRSTIQELTFNEAKESFRKYKVGFEEVNYRSLGVRTGDGELYTNLGLLLSDQCLHTTKIAVFDDSECTVFKDSREFSGSILKQVEEAYTYLSLCNRTSANIIGLKRVEQKDYPDEALREAILNAIVHRDYSYSGSIIINVNALSIEFVSIGGLVAGLSIEDIRAGISQPRNKKLAEVFHRLGLIESYGTGIRRVYALYKNASAQPQIEVTSNTFKLVLPKQNADEGGDEKEEAAASVLTPQMKEILAFIGRNGAITDGIIGDMFHIQSTRIYNLIKQMERMGLIRIEGRGKGKRYVANTDSR